MRVFVCVLSEIFQYTCCFSADPQVPRRLLPRRGGTQTSRGLLTAHLQTMILNFESVQKQKVLTLKNKIKELQDIAAVLKTENKTLRQNKKQNDREMTEIAAMISYHERNVKELRSKVRESEISVTTQDSKSRKQNAVLVKLNDKYKEYQELLDNVNLQDSEVLEEKIEEAEKQLSGKDEKMTVRSSAPPKYSFMETLIQNTNPINVLGSGANAVVSEEKDECGGEKRAVSLSEHSKQHQSEERGMSKPEGRDSGESTR